MARTFALVVAGALIALPLQPRAADCSGAIESLSFAYKAYNDCSAAGRGAQGCAPETAAYEAARQRLDDCRAQGAASSSSEPDFKSRFEDRERDDGRPRQRRESKRYPEQRRLER